jgi:hypothetical protein
MKESSIVDYAGLDYKLIAQFAPIIFQEMLPTSWLKLWVATSRLVTTIYTREITDISGYTTKLRLCVRNVLKGAMCADVGLLRFIYTN